MQMYVASGLIAPEASIREVRPKARLASVGKGAELAATGFPFFLFVPGNLGVGLSVWILDQRDLFPLRSARNQCARRGQQKDSRDPSF
jgi:hypothetical protein